MKAPKSETYEHTLEETCCDVCKKKIDLPLYLKIENEWKIWFFCSDAHKQDFRKREQLELMMLQ